MRLARTISLILLTVFFSATILSRVAIFGISFNPVLIVSLFLTFQIGFKEGLIWAVLGGLMLDVFGIGIPSNILLLPGIILLDKFLTRSFLEASQLIVFIAFCFFDSLIYDFLFLISHSIPLVNYSLFIPVGNAFYTTLLGLVIYFVHRRFTKTTIVLER